jgi:hypothetical protein
MGQKRTYCRDTIHSFCRIEHFIPWFRQMEDPMCWEIDYKLFAELEKARETKVKQEQRAVVIDNLLNEANRQGDKTNVDGTTVKEVAPAK